MIIVPTEKQFTWRHAPIVLFFLVLLNILVFFLYQSGDNTKIQEALASYQKSEFFEREWPIFVNYLEENKEQELLETYREQYRDEDYEEILGDMLMREEFYVYLKHHAGNFFYQDFYSQWSIERERIHNLLQSLSYVSHGLIANDLHVPAFFTHQFLHGDIMHLLGNMFFLIVCGFAVEAAVGHWRFLLFYLVAGCAGGFAHVASNWEGSTPLVGASGAISGVMAMYLAVFRLKRIEFFYWFFFFAGYFRAPALLILPFYIGKEVHNFYSDTESNVAFMAHAGGFVAGALLIGVAILINRSMLNTQYIETDQGIDPHQQELAEIYSAIEKYCFDQALALVNRFIKANGPSFKMAMIRYNLLKISRGDEFIRATISLLTLPMSTPDELEKLDKIWRNNSEIHTLLGEQQALKLGMQFTELESLQSAEQLFKCLETRGCKNPAMSVFASKLANAFQAKREPHKKAHYDNLAQKFSSQHLQPSQGV